MIPSHPVGDDKPLRNRLFWKSFCENPQPDLNRGTRYERVPFDSGLELTLRYRYEPLFPGLEPRWNAKDIGPNRYVYAFWHENILVPAYRMRNLDIAVLISRHADGQLIARAVEWLGFQTVRGSSTRGGVLAIKGMVAQARKFHLAITPDGPKGPRRKCQQGWPPLPP